LVHYEIELIRGCFALLATEIGSAIAIASPPRRDWRGLPSPSFGSACMVTVEPMRAPSPLFLQARSASHPIVTPSQSRGGILSRYIITENHCLIYNGPSNSNSRAQLEVLIA
jgi:hypothetical protein